VAHIAQNAGLRAEAGDLRTSRATPRMGTLATPAGEAGKNISIGSRQLVLYTRWFFGLRLH